MSDQTRSRKGRSRGVDGRDAPPVASPPARRPPDVELAARVVIAQVHDPHHRVLAVID